MRATEKLVFIASVQELLSAEETFLAFYRTAIVFGGLAVGAARLGVHPSGYALLGVLTAAFLVYGAGHYQETVHRLRGPVPRALTTVPLFLFSFLSLALLVAVIVVFYLPRG